MGEIKMNDLQEINRPAGENYMDIKPQAGMTPKEARANWNNEFNRIYPILLKKDRVIRLYR